ncbi:MAG: TIGR04197 family type VII secretion effector [Clostridiales bacterium]
MAADKLKIMVDKMKDKSNKFNKLRRKYIEEIIIPLSDFKKEMDGIWTGEACEAFEERMKKHSNDLEKIAEIIDEVSMNIKNVAEDFDGVDNKIANKIKNSF